MSTATLNTDSAILDAIAKTASSMANADQTACMVCVIQEGQVLIARLNAWACDMFGIPQIDRKNYLKQSIYGENVALLIPGLSAAQHDSKVVKHRDRSDEGENYMMAAGKPVDAQEIDGKQFKIEVTLKYLLDDKSVVVAYLQPEGKSDRSLMIQRLISLYTWATPENLKTAAARVRETSASAAQLVLAIVAALTLLGSGTAYVINGVMEEGAKVVRFIPNARRVEAATVDKQPEILEILERHRVSLGADRVLVGFYGLTEDETKPTILIKKGWQVGAVRS
jgi:hypothetical protein